MKVVILAGGFGTRLSDYTKDTPKPLVRIGKFPIIIHIMKHYYKYGYNNFYVALGYKGNEIKKYFKKKKFKWKVNLIETGKNTMTGGRILRMKEELKDNTFLLTYGDGVSNVNLNKLIKFHNKNKKMVTLTAVRPPARFGAIKIKNKLVYSFKEKSKLDEGWINGGFFVINPEFISFIKNDKTYLEREPLEKASKLKQLIAYKHTGFWQCMDTKRDKLLLEKFYKKNKFF